TARLLDRHPCRPTAQPQRTRLHRHPDPVLRQVRRLRQGLRRRMSRVLDPEGAHLAALRRLGDFRDRRILELGCGDGRLTVPIATEAASVLAFDPDAEAVERARLSLPDELADRVAYRGASGQGVE